MPFKIIRADLVSMACDAIVNTANEYPIVGPGCDTAVYNAAGREALLEVRRKIGQKKPGEAFITPGFNLPARYIIHAVSPLFINGNEGEEELLRNCYRNSLVLAREHGCRSIAFPLIATGSYHFPKEDGMRIAADEINAFLLQNDKNDRKDGDMQIYLVVFGDKAASLGEKLYPDLESYIDQNYVRRKQEEEYGFACFESSVRREALACPMPSFAKTDSCRDEDDYEARLADLENALDERMKHLTDTFSEYLIYLIQSKGMTNAEVYKRAIVDKKVFSKIKNNPDYHPNKMTAMCLCVGAKLNSDEARDLLARAGYALSPCDKTDIIFSYFIERGIYDMIELDLQLEERGLPCLIA